MILDDTLKDGEMRIYKDLHNGWFEEEQTINIRQYGKTQKIINELSYKLKRIEEYVDSRNDIPIEVVINIKNIINGGRNE